MFCKQELFFIIWCDHGNIVFWRPRQKWNYFLNRMSYLYCSNKKCRYYKLIRSFKKDWVHTTTINQFSVCFSSEQKKRILESTALLVGLLVITLCTQATEFTWQSISLISFHAHCFFVCLLSPLDGVERVSTICSVSFSSWVCCILFLVFMFQPTMNSSFNSAL